MTVHWLGFPAHGLWAPELKPHLLVWNFHVVSCSYSGFPLNASSHLVLFCWQMCSKWNVSKSYYFDFLKNHHCLKFPPNDFCFFLPNWTFCIEVLAWIWNRITTTLWRAEGGLPAPLLSSSEVDTLPYPQILLILHFPCYWGLNMTLTFVNSCCGSWQLLNYLWWIGWSHLISPKGRWYME